MKSIIEILKKHSIKEILGYFVTQILKTDFKKFGYFRLNTNIEQVDEKLKGFELDVQPLTLEMVLKGDPNVFKGKKLELYKKRFKDPAYYGYGIMENDSLIYSTWFSTENLGLPGVTKRIPLLPNEGLLEDSYCAPSARGRGLHGKMNNYRLKKLYEKGRNRIIAIVMYGNTPALKVQLKCGFEELGTFYMGKVFGIQFCTLNKKQYDNK